jgi:regulator of RNase E activity RraA
LAVVTDGCVRDVPEIATLDLPVYAGAAHAGVFGTQHLAADINVPIGCAGVLVMPGDLLVGDAEGVVVVPAGVADEIAARAAAQEKMDVFLREKISQGVPLARAYPPDAEIQAEYQAWQARQRGD